LVHKESPARKEKEKKTCDVRGYRKGRVYWKKSPVFPTKQGEWDALPKGKNSGCAPWGRGTPSEGGEGSVSSRRWKDGSRPMRGKKPSSIHIFSDRTYRGSPFSSTKGEGLDFPWKCFEEEELSNSLERPRVALIVGGEVERVGPFPSEEKECANGELPLSNQIKAGKEKRDRAGRI